MDFLRLKMVSGRGFCQPYSCLNGGDCIEEETNFHCDCPKRFKGRYCQIRIAICTEETCFNGGQCVENADNFHCNCPEGFEGRQCEQTYSTATTAQISKKNNKFDNHGTIIGGLVGGIVGLCILAALIAYIWKKKQPRSSGLAGFGRSEEYLSAKDVRKSPDPNQPTENNVYDEIPMEGPPRESLRKYSGQYATIIMD